MWITLILKYQKIEPEELNQAWIQDLLQKYSKDSVGLAQGHTNTLVEVRKRVWQVSMQIYKGTNGFSIGIETFGYFMEQNETWPLLNMI